MKFTVPERELRFSFSRSSGPGGQNVNKVNSKAVLHWQIADCADLPFAVAKRFRERYANLINKEGDVVVSSDKFRDQARNMNDCREKLHEMLASVWTPPKKRIPTKPTTGARMRRLSGKKARGDVKKNRGKVSYD